MHRKVVVVVAALVASLSLSLCAAVQAAPVPVSDVVAQPIAAGGTCAPTGASPADAPAATHRDVCVAFDMDTTSDDVKTIKISLPAGVVGDPGATPRCSFATDSSGTPTGDGDCTSANQVGSVTSTASVPGFGDQTLSGAVYNLTPSSTQPALLGIKLTADNPLLATVSTPTYLLSPIRVRVPDAGLDSVTDNVPNTSSGMNISVKSMAILLWGAQVDHTSMTKPFMALPTRCDVDATTVITVTSYSGDVTSGHASFRPTDCDKVPFTPDLAVGPTTAPADTPGAAWAQLLLPGTDTGTGENARRQAYLKDVQLRLPAGLALNPPLANGLIPCTPEQFGQDKDATPQCPANTVMGSVEFQTPIFPGQTLHGKVYFGTPQPGKPLINYISVEDPRLRLKLVGYGTIDPDTTAITAHFEDQPQVPFTSFKFIYEDLGGGRSTLTSPVNCGTYPVTAAMTPWNGGATAAPTKTFEINGCQPPAFAPTLGAAVTTTQAGADTGLVIHIVRPDKNLRLQDMTVSLPPGLTGRLTAVPPCPVAAARASACPDASQVGTASVAVGTGPAPLRLPGKVYLTDGFDGGIAGLAVTVDTKVPALDLGLVTVLNKIVLRQDAGIDVITQGLPQKLDGIPTVYQNIDLTIDKPGFMRNATSCDPLMLHGTFASVGAAMSATSDAPYQATGCQALPFAPKLSATLGAAGQNGPRGHPPLTVTITQADGEAAMRQTVVTLPDGIAVDLKNLKAACSPDQLNAGTCPAASRLGTVTADTPLLPQALTGGAYLMQPLPGHLPGIALDLGGLVRLTGAVSLTPKGRLVTTFDGEPDVPLRKLVLALSGGPTAVLETSIDQCSATPAVDVSTIAHSGATTSSTVPVQLVGCTPLKAAGTLKGVKKRRPALQLPVTAAHALKELRLKLPRSLRPRSVAALRRVGRLTLDGKRRRDGLVRYTRGQIRCWAPATTAKTWQIALPAGSLRIRGRLKAGSTVKVLVTGIDEHGKVVTTVAKLKAAR